MRALIILIMIISIMCFGEPAMVTLVSPEINAVDISVDTTLNWQAVPGDLSYGLQVSVESDFSTTLVDEIGLSTTTYDVSDLPYWDRIYWRVNATDTTGTGLWSTGAFQTQVAPPVAPTLETPTDGAVNVETPIRLNWANVDNAMTYGVEVYNDSLLTSIYAHETGLVSSYYDYMGGFPRGATYYWRANAANNTGTSPWSAVFSFSTPPNSPADPMLISPEDSSPIEATFVWNAAENASTYTLKLSRGTMDNVVLTETGLTDTTFSLTLEYETTYHWKVCAVNFTDTRCSNFQHFTTIAAPPLAVSLNVPPEGTTLDVDSATLVWSPWPSALAYRVKVGTQPGGTDILDDSTVTETGVRVYELENGTYYWTVTAKNLAGWGTESSTHTFNVEKPPTGVKTRVFNPVSKRVHLTVLDARGRVIASGATPAHRLNLAKGVYVTVREVDGLVTRRSMLVR